MDRKGNALHAHGVYTNMAAHTHSHKSTEKGMNKISLLFFLFVVPPKYITGSKYPVSLRNI